MSTITTRSGKGSPLTNNEVDANFTNLNNDKLESADLSGYAELTGATFTGEVEAAGFNGDLTGAILFKGQAGEALTKGDPVYISGISGNKTVVSKADANDSSKMPCFGIVDATVSANADCSVVTFGTLQGLDTSSYSEGDELFVSDTGALTTTAPTGESSQIQKIGKVTRSHASAGSIKVMGAGRTNAVPNLDDGQFFLGNGSNQAVSSDFAASVLGEISAGTGIGISASGVISNTAPDQTVVLTGSGATSISGTYPNFTISSTDNNTTYSAGTGVTLAGTTFSLTDTNAKLNLTGGTLTGALSGTTATFSGNLNTESDIRVGTAAGAINQTGIIKENGSAYGLGFFTWGDTAPVQIGGGSVNLQKEAGGGVDLKINGTTVIDSSRNLTNITNISSTINGNNTTGGNLFLGATSNNAPKWGSIVMRQYNSDTETEGYTIIKGASGNGSNTVMIGGGMSEQNAASTVYVLAASNTSTRSGTEIARFTTDGFDVRNNNIRITGTTVIDSSRNLTNIGTYTGQGLATITNSSNQHLRLAYSSGFYWDIYRESTTGDLVFDSSNTAGEFVRFDAVDKTISTIAGYKVNGTTVIDSSRNLTNIGTISSGAITSSGSLKVGSGTQTENSDANITIREGNAFAGFDFHSTRTAGNIGGLRWYSTSSNSVPESQLLVETDGTLRYYNGTNGAQNVFSISNTGAITSSGDMTLKGNLLLGGTATTTNQARTIDFTGFDKESTTDFTDRAFIQHTTNTGGHSGSVLVISSENDANDGIAFETNGSSQLKHNSNTIWTAGNDGSGSGLDADLLDGQQGSYYFSDGNKPAVADITGLIEGTSFNGTYPIVFNIGGANRLFSENDITYTGGTNTLNSTGGNYSTTSPRNRFTTPSGYIELGPMNTSYAHIYTDRGSFYFNKTTLYADGNTMWTAGNDGSGSGLDADLLDGQHGSYYRSASNLNAGTLPDARLATSTTYNLGGIKVSAVANDQNYIAFSGTTGDQNGNYNHTYIGERIHSGSESSELVLAKYNDVEGTSGSDRIRHIANNHVFQTYTSAVTPNTNASLSGAVGTGTLYTRMTIRQNGDIEVGGSKFIDSNRNITATRFRSANGTIAPLSSSYTFSNVFTSEDSSTRVAYFDGNGGNASVWWGNGSNAHAALDSGDGLLDVWVNPSNGSWYNIADFSTSGLNVTTGTARVGGNTVWHAGNDGSGSGLDADTLRGISGDNYLRKDIQQTMSANILFANSTTAKRGISGTMSDNDQWFVGGAGTGSNAGYLEISTGDDGQTSGSAEYIYVRQYGPGSPLTGTLTRTAALLDNYGNTYFPGNVTAYYSDERLKTKTGNITNAIEKVQSLSGFYYVENELAKQHGYSTETQQVGLSAQEVKAVLPEAVSLAPFDRIADEVTNDSVSKSGEEYLTVDYSRLVPLLIESIKELKSEVDDLKTQLETK